MTALSLWKKEKSTCIHLPGSSNASSSAPRRPNSLRSFKSSTIKLKPSSAIGLLQRSYSMTLSSKAFQEHLLPQLFQPQRKKGLAIRSSIQRSHVFRVDSLSQQTRLAAPTQLVHRWPTTLILMIEGIEILTYSEAELMVALGG